MRVWIDVVSAGGTMNRVAVALGVPVYTTYARGESEPSTSPRSRRAGSDVLEQRAPATRPIEGRDPTLLLDLLVAAH